MMNQNKKNNGWILCPSKSFPGKFYYFNVVNGEAAWSVENQTLKRDFKIHKLADKSHSFPEPSSPPTDDIPNVSFSHNSFLKKPIYNAVPKRVINNMQTPIFGQAIFPNYVEPFMPNIIWTPIQIPPPMYITRPPDMGMKMPVDRIGQSRDQDCSLFVQTCDLSLSKRFEMYAKHSTVNTNAGNRDAFNKFYETSTPIKSSFDGKIMDNSQIFGSKGEASFQKPEEKAKSFIRQPVLKRVWSHSKTESKVQSSIHRSSSAESLVNFDNSALMKSTLSEGDKVASSSNNKKEKLDDLDSNDLRFLLVAKRRKSVDLGDHYSSSEGKKIKTTKVEVPSTTPKKRVTFDLGDQVSSDGVDDEMEENIDISYDDVSPISQDAEDSLLYIAVDLDTLLHEYDFIEEYTQSEDNRRLLIPHKLQSEIEAVCLGDCCGRQRVIAARQITRKLVTPPDYYVLIPEASDSPNSVQCLIVDNHTDNYILNTCLQWINSGNRVMLITNNKDLYNDAKTLNIDYFTTQELKDGAVIAKPEVTFDLIKVQTPVANEKKTNLFLQPASDFKPYLVKNKEEIPENTLKKRLFIDDKEKKHFQKTNNNFKDANTSPIDTRLLDLQNDRLIDITRKKLPSMPQIEKNYNPATEIGLDIQNLFIKEKPKNEVSNEKHNVRFENGSCEKRKEPFQKGSQPENESKNSLDDFLSVYSVKNKEMEENIKARLDEWTCCFTQLMENTLIDILEKHSPITDKLSPPWVLYESVRKIQDVYGSHTEVNKAAEKFKCMLLNHSSKIGKLKSYIKPNDFIKIVGSGIILIEALKSTEPSTSLEDAANSLSALLQSMSQPAPDIPMTTPVLTRGDHDTINVDRQNYIKKLSEIIEYLKAHFSDWKDFEIPPDCDDRKNKVVRTFGRDLNLLKIDNNKSISFKSRTMKIVHAVSNTAFDKAQNSTKIDGISTINNEKLPLNPECDNGYKVSPIVFRKFDSSFIFKGGNDKNKISSTDNVIIVTDNIDMSNNNEAKSCDVPKTTESKENIPTNVVRNDKNEPKIIRIFNNLFKQNSDNLTTSNNEDLNVPKHGNTFNQSTDTAGPKVIRTFDNLFLPKINDKSITKQIIKDLNVPKHGNTFNQENETAGPKVIRNIKPIDEFEGKIKENAKYLDLDALDYSEINSLSESEMLPNEDTSVEDNVSFVYAIRKPIICNKNIAEINDNALDNDYVTTKMNDDCVFNNVNINDNASNSCANNCNSPMNNVPNSKMTAKDDTTDSGFENESIHAYSLVKIFLAELSESVKAIYEFIVKSIDEFREDDNREEKKRKLHEKANRTHLVIAGIIVQLKSIIQRESNEVTTVRPVFLKAGVQASSDKRMTRYRQVVTKCLEQAQILENALKTVLSLTDDLDASVSNDSRSDIRYFNIFE